MLKASELFAKTHRLLVHCFDEAGILKGVINIRQAKHEDAAEVTEAIIAHKAIRKIDFVGSAAIGKQICQVCAKYLKPVLTEAGGKGPALVLQDADLQKAAFLYVAGGKLTTAGLCTDAEDLQPLQIMGKCASLPNTSSCTRPSTNSLLTH